MAKIPIVLTLCFCVNIKEQSKMLSYKVIQTKLDMTGLTSKH